MRQKRAAECTQFVRCKNTMIMCSVCHSESAAHFPHTFFTFNFLTLALSITFFTRPRARASPVAGSFSAYVRNESCVAHVNRQHTLSVFGILSSLALRARFNHSQCIDEQMIEKEER